MADDPILKKLKEGRAKRSALRGGRSMRGPSQRPFTPRGGRPSKTPMPRTGGGLGIQPRSAFWIGRALMRDMEREESMMAGQQGRQLLETGRMNEFGRISQTYDAAIKQIDDLLMEDVP